MMFDVAVIGAGPSGAIAAKTCANNNLKTILVERKPLPRDKPCGGWLISAAVQIIQEKFRKIPKSLLERKIEEIILLPDCKFHQPIDAVSIDRKSFDYWLTKNAEKAGAVIHNATLKSLSQEHDCIVMKLKTNNLKQKISAKYIVGADGAFSTVRSCLYPNQKRQFAATYQAYVKGQLPKNAVYVYFPLEETRVTYFWVIPKKKTVVVGIGGLPPINLKKRLRNFLLMVDEKFGLEQILKYEAHPLPIFSPVDFRSGERRVLLVGDAAGLVNPFNGEGISTSLVTGKAASEAIMENFNHPFQVLRSYKEKLKFELNNLRKMYELFTYYQLLNYKERQTLLENYFQTDTGDMKSR